MKKSFLITIQAGYSREWERDVDKYGVKLAYLSGYDPKGSVNSLRKIADASGSWSSSCFLWDTHPAMQERVQLLNTEIAMLKFERIEEKTIKEPLIAAITENEISIIADSTADIILRNDRSIIKSSVLGITNETIRYKSIDQLDGPIRNELNSNVLMIIYKNGRRELFNKNYIINNSLVDIIYKNDGSPIKSEVIDINSETVKYKNIDQIDGPIRNILITDVLMIIYSDGRKRTFR